MRIPGYLSDETIFNEGTAHKGRGLAAIKVELIQKPPSSGPVSMIFLGLYWPKQSAEN